MQRRTSSPCQAARRAGVARSEMESDRTLGLFWDARRHGRVPRTRRQALGGAIVTPTTLLSLRGSDPAADWLAWNREKGLGSWTHPKSFGLAGWDGTVPCNPILLFCKADVPNGGTHCPRGHPSLCFRLLPATVWATQWHLRLPCVLSRGQEQAMKAVLPPPAGGRVWPWG